MIAVTLVLDEKGRVAADAGIVTEGIPQTVESAVRAAVDETLRRLNSDYDAKRFKDMALRRPVVHSVAEGTFFSWMKERGKIGGQHKVPRLANNREYVDSILKMMEPVL